MKDSCKLLICIHISHNKFHKILRLFPLYLIVLQIDEICHLNHNTANRHLILSQTLIADFCEQESPFSGEVECDEFYFGSRHQKGNFGRGAENKHIVFGIYKRNRKVYTNIVENIKTKTLQAIIKGKVSFDSPIYRDGFRPYNSIFHLGYQKHYRIYHQANYALGDIHINGIESIWEYAKVRLVKFRDLSKNTFCLHL